MAKQSNVRANSRYSRAPLTKRPHSHLILEGFLLLSAFGILCVLFSFFVLELHRIASRAFTNNIPAETPSQQLLTPPRVEARVVESQLSLVEVDDLGNILRTLFRSDLSDDIADFTLFAIPQTGYTGLIYVRPILDGNLPNLTVYPLDVATGTLKAATLNVASDAYLLSPDQTLVGVYANTTLTLYALEDGVILAQGPIPQDWNKLLALGRATLTLTENACLSLTSSLAPEDLSPFSPICP